MKNKLISALLLVASPFVIATQPHMAIIDLSYVKVDEPDLDGEQFKLQLPIKNGLYVSYDRLSLDGDTNDSGYSSKALGGGFFWGSAASSLMYLGYSKVELEAFELDDEFTRYELGWRKRLSRQLEMNLEYNQTEFNLEGVDDVGYRVGFHYYMSPTFAITLDADRWFEQDRIFLGVRFTSGK